MNLTVEPRIEKNAIANRVSAYKPSDLIKRRFSQLRSEMATADEIRNKTYKEFNNRSLLTYQDDCQKAFNNYVPPTSDAPAEKWKANTIRPLTRNKVISIAAHVTSQILQPTVLAQNKDSKEDKQAALVMKDLMDYVLDESKYARHFVNGVISALVNPIIIFEQGFAEVKRKFKEITADGWKEVEKIDEVFSGFFTSLVPTEEFFIGNFNEPDLQKQPFVFRRKVIDYENAKIKYAQYPEFKFVQKGVRVFFSEQDNSFYESEDDVLTDRQVEEIIYYNRFADLELIIINGVLMGNDPDRPMQRLDKFYPFAKSGYETFDEQCFYYKSLVDKIAPDQTVIDKLYNMVIDGTYLRLFPPTASYGAETWNSKVLIPGAVFHKRDVNSKMESILPPQDVAGGLNMLQKVEASASESSQDPMQAGRATKGSQTAFEVARLEENARTVLGLFGKSLGFLAEDVGTLCVGSIIQNMTVAEVEETTSDGAKLIFKSVLIPERSVDGKKMPHRVDFEMFDEEAPVEERFQMQGLDEMQQRVLQKSMQVKEEGEKEGVKISKVNPGLFRALKFKVKAGSDFMKPSSEAIIKALNLEAYDRMINNPLLNQEEVTRKFLLGTYVPNEEDKFIAKQLEQPIGQVGKVAPAQGAIQQVLAKRMQMSRV